MKIVLIGIQGSGKSTQGNKLAEKLNVPYLSTGHIARELAKEKTPLGRFIKETINAGFLIPDETMIKIVNEYLEKPEYKNGFIIDGYPRTLPQAIAFNGTLDHVVYLKVSDEMALERLSFRHEEREDEGGSALKKRIDLFHELTEPVLEHYRQKGILIEVDGEQDKEKIHQDVLAALKING